MLPDKSRRTPTRPVFASSQNSTADSGRCEARGHFAADSFSRSESITALTWCHRDTEFLNSSATPSCKIHQSRTSRRADGPTRAPGQANRYEYVQRNINYKNALRKNQNLEAWTRRAVHFVLFLTCCPNANKTFSCPDIPSSCQFHILNWLMSIVRFCCHRRAPSNCWRASLVASDFTTFGFRELRGKKIDHSDGRIVSVPVGRVPTSFGNWKRCASK